MYSHPKRSFVFSVKAVNDNMIIKNRQFYHSIGMNSSATHLKFACPRMSDYACY